MSYRIGICRWGECLKSQTVHSENLEFVFGLVKGYGAVQSIWEYQDGLGRLAEKLNIPQ